MPKKEPSHSIEQKSGSVGSQKNSFEAAKSAFDKAKDITDELKGAIAYLDRGPVDFSTDDIEQQLDRTYRKYHDAEPEELKERLTVAEESLREAKRELQASAAEAAKSELKKIHETQEQLDEARKNEKDTATGLRQAEKHMRDMEDEEEQFLKKYGVPHSKTRDRDGIKSEWEESIEGGKRRLKNDNAALRKAQQSYDELKKLGGNFLMRLMNGSKIKELEESMNLPVFGGDPDKMLESFKENVERTKGGIERDENKLQKLNARIESGAFAGSTPEFEAEKNATKARIEDLTLKHIQAQKRLREIEATQSRLSTLIKALDLPASKNLDEQKQTLSEFLEKT